MNRFTAKLCLGSGALAVVTLICYLIRSKRSKSVVEDTAKREAEADRAYMRVINSLPEAWDKVGTVKELWLYPLKSGKGCPVDSCFFDTAGITITKGDTTLKDRLLVAYSDATRKFATARQYPKLLMAEAVSVNQNVIKLSAPGMPDLEFELPVLRKDTVDSLTMWFGETVECLNCGSEANEWISKYLLDKDKGCRLGLSSPESRRVTTIGAWEKHARLYENLRDKDTGLFSDLASYMLLSQSSVDDLNQRLEHAIEPLQLRPNIVVEGCEPYAEDKWEYIKLGEEAIIRQFKAVPRCTMININPESGERNSRGEPLCEIKKYRIFEDPQIKELEKNAPCFGIYCGSIVKGCVKVNDNVYVYRPHKDVFRPRLNNSMSSLIKFRENLKLQKKE